MRPHKCCLSVEFSVRALWEKGKPIRNISSIRRVKLQSEGKFAAIHRCQLLPRKKARSTFSGNITQDLTSSSTDAKFKRFSYSGLKSCFTSWPAEHQPIGNILDGSKLRYGLNLYPKLSESCQSLIYFSWDPFSSSPKKSLQLPFCSRVSSISFLSHTKITNCLSTQYYPRNLLSFRKDDWSTPSYTSGGVGGRQL